MSDQPESPVPQSDEAASQPTPEQPAQDFWSGLEADAVQALEQQQVSPDQVVTISTPAGQMLTIPIQAPTSIRDILSNAQLSLAPNATFLVDGTFVQIEHEVAPGGHVVVSVPLKGG